LKRVLSGWLASLEDALSLNLHTLVAQLAHS